MKDETIYIVSSFHRSGSSMMMQCLEAGGLETLIDHEASKSLKDFFTTESYDPNPKGFYQAPSGILQDPNFLNVCVGKVLKVYFFDLETLPKGDYEIVFMKRDPVEIQKSLRQMTGGLQTPDEDRLVNYEQKISDLFVELEKRGDMNITVLNYRDVIENPTREFLKLQNFPIDISAAVQMVEPSLYRFKLESI